MGIMIKDQPFTVGITGGMGSGKSTAAHYFRQQGLFIVDADCVARDSVATESHALEAIARHFGPTILQHDKTLHRQRLRHIIFQDQAQKKWLENLLHPIIHRNIKKQLSKAKTSAYAICVSPLLFETSQNQFVQRTLVIDATETTQIRRIQARDGSSEQHIAMIIQTQFSREERCKRGNDRIFNEGSIEALYQQLSKLHQDYLTMAREHNCIAHHKRATSNNRT